jgi:GNAT superfamily N-acetyltransferase
MRTPASPTTPTSRPDHTPPGDPSPGDPSPGGAADAGLVFRRATPDDVLAVLDLVETAYRGDASRAGWTTEADLVAGQRTDAEAIHVIVTSSTGLVLLAEADPVSAAVVTGSTATATDAGLGEGTGGGPGPTREIVGCCQLERRGEVGYFGMFAVRPGQQGGGTGSALLAAAERYVRAAWGARRMELFVISVRAELIDWYARRGYRPTGATEPFPYGDERFGLPLRDDLAFAVLAKSLDEEPGMLDEGPSMLDEGPGTSA